MISGYLLGNYTVQSFNVHSKKKSRLRIRMMELIGFTRRQRSGFLLFCMNAIWEIKVKTRILASS
jgi:hypothetical protein